MAQRLSILQEDLKNYESFISEISLYNRDLATSIHIGLSNNDPQTIEVLSEGIGTAMERGADLGGKAARALNFTGRTSRFLGIPGLMQGGAALAAGGAHLLGANVGGSRPPKPAEETSSSSEGPTMTQIGRDSTVKTRVRSSRKAVTPAGTTVHDTIPKPAERESGRTETNDAAASASGDEAHMERATDAKKKSRAPETHGEGDSSGPKTRVENKLSYIVGTIDETIGHQLASRSADNISSILKLDVTSGETVNAAVALGLIIDR